MNVIFKPAKASFTIGCFSFLTAVFFFSFDGASFLETSFFAVVVFFSATGVSLIGFRVCSFKTGFSVSYSISSVSSSIKSSSFISKASISSAILEAFLGFVVVVFGVKSIFSNFVTVS